MHKSVIDDNDVVDAKTYPGKADLVPKVVEAADAVLGVLVVVVLDEAEPEVMSAWQKEGDRKAAQSHPLQRPVLRSMIDFELLMSPNREPQASSISSVVAGRRPRM